MQFFRDFAVFRKVRGTGSMLEVARLIVSGRVAVEDDEDVVASAALRCDLSRCGFVAIELCALRDLKAPFSAVRRPMALYHQFCTDASCRIVQRERQPQFAASRQAAQRNSQRSSERVTAFCHVVGLTFAAKWLNSQPPHELCSHL